MSEFASAIANTGFQQNPDSQTHLKSQTGGGKRSFEDVLQNNEQQNQTGTSNVNNQGVSPINTDQVTTSTSGAKLEQLRFDLMNKISEMNPSQGPISKSDVLPDLIYAKTRMGLLKEALVDVKTLPKGTELMGRLSQVEGEYNQLEAIMKSNKDLSPGELLGLQARLYQVSQHIEVMSKVVDQVTGGIKTILNTNV